MINNNTKDIFIDALQERCALINPLLADNKFRSVFSPKNLADAVFSYVDQGGKRLRPALLMLSCGAFGGDEKSVLPAACAVELFHTWTLVHDDIIDNDDLRRGIPTQHIASAQQAPQDWIYQGKSRAEYGRDMAILAGDLQHGWAVSMMLDCAKSAKIDPNIVINLTQMMESEVIADLIKGETLDIQFSLMPFEQITEEKIVEMMWLKTGVLLRFSALAGASLGAGKLPNEDPKILAIAEFAGKCGLAFQLQDDILGIVGDEKELGKPIGSDIIEGKRTVIILRTIQQANPKDRRLLLENYGKDSLKKDELAEIKTIIEKYDGIEHAKKLANSFLKEATTALDTLPESEYKEIFKGWQEFMIQRKY